MSVLREDSEKPVLAGESEQCLDLGYGCRCIRNEQFPFWPNEIVLHIDDDQRRGAGVDLHFGCDRVLRDFDCSRHGLPPTPIRSTDQSTELGLTICTANDASHPVRGSNVGSGGHTTIPVILSPEAPALDLLARSLRKE